MTVQFEAPKPKMYLEALHPAGSRTWPLPPVYLVGIGTLVVAFGHLETFEKMLALRLSGASEHFGRLVLGGMRASDIRAMVRNLAPTSNEFEPHCAEILLLNRAATLLQGERNDVVHKAWLHTAEGKVVITDELTAKSKAKPVIKEVRLDRMYDLADAATVLSFRTAAFLTDPSERAAAVESRRNAYPMSPWFEKAISS